MNIELKNIRIDKIKNLYQPFDVEVDVLRLDLIHEVISGNKWFKLMPWLELAKSSGKKTIVTFGGAYSNHIVATAAACSNQGLNAIGIIRGERPATYSPTLREAAGYGMELYFISRDAYREKCIPVEITKTSDDFYLIPEGGFGTEGRIGAEAICSYIGDEYSHITCAVGTGTTLAGLVNASSPKQQLTGFSVMKNNFSLEAAVNKLLPPQKQNRFSLLHDFYFGGYAKHDNSLIHFMNEWFQKTGIPSDFVYTGKSFFATDQLVKNKYFPAGSKVLSVHSGGLQGNRSLKTGTLIF
jgi:1-aminocyclopropane-1-carboxylate deaminase